MKIEKFDALNLEVGKQYNVTYFTGVDTQRHICSEYDGTDEKKRFAYFKEKNWANDFYRLPISRITKIV